MKDTKKMKSLSLIIPVLLIVVLVVATMISLKDDESTPATEGGATAELVGSAAATDGAAPKGCSAEDEAASDASDDALWNAVGVTRVGPVETPGFTLDDLSGNKVSIDDYKGRVVLLNFWATWCPPCKAEMPAMENLHNTLHGEGLSVVAIDDYEKKEKVVKFIKENPYTFDILIDPSGRTSEDYKAMMLPTSFIIDKEGMAVGKVVGMREWDSPESIELFRSLLKQ